MTALTDTGRVSLRQELERIVGQGSVLSDPDELLTYESDGLTLFRALADFVAFPRETAQVAAIVKLANLEALPFVARGAGTGLSGGCLPTEGGIVISLMATCNVTNRNKLTATLPAVRKDRRLLRRAFLKMKPPRDIRANAVCFLPPAGGVPFPDEASASPGLRRAGRA